MAHKLMSAREFQTAIACYQTLHTGEKVMYDITSREVKMMRGNGGIRDVPMISIRRQGDAADIGGWYPMSALVFVMPDGSTRK